MGERTSERRRFSTSERVALFLAAGGRCTECGAKLGPDWHGDHVEPWSHGGPTDVINGQALCPDCNLRKGDRYVKLWEWQDEALRRFLGHEADYLCEATPGAGKTRFALAAARQLMEHQGIRQLIVIVPTRHLRRQWATVAARDFGIQLDPNFEHKHGTVARDYDGVVATYSAVGTEPLLYRHYVGQDPTLVILDEIHHAGEQRSWGSALRRAFEPATRRLLLSGTPFRTDGGAIPFVDYDEQDIAKADYSYGYGRALGDQVVRPIGFPAFDGEARWRSAGEITAKLLSEADDADGARALAAALDPNGEWIGSVLQQGDRELTSQRETVPDAGGLVIAADQYKARRYAAMLAKITGEKPTLAISDEPDASGRIAAFEQAAIRWIVAVQMVSEGVDIPRLAVGIYASDYRTELFFQQVVGRFVRLRHADDVTCATLFVPSIEPILGYAKRILEVIPRALRAAQARAEQDAKSQQPTLLDLVEPPAWEPVGSSEATHYATIFSGESFADDELRRAEEVRQLAGAPGSWKPEQVARLLRVAGAGRVVGRAVLDTPRPAVGLADQKKPLRKLVNAKANAYAMRNDIPHSHVHAELNRACHEPNIGLATVETLNKRLELLDHWLGGGA